MSSAKVGLGLGARGLKDKDWGPGVSDPYVVISRPSASGGFQMLRTSEVKKNSLNPDWNDFLFTENELNGGDETLKLKIEVFDDDGKKGPDGKDKLLGTGYFSLKELEASATVRSPLQLGDGKKGKRAGDLLVRSVTRHAATGVNSGAPGGVGAYPAPQGAYPAPGGPTGAPSHGYPGAPGTGYPAPGSGYPAAGSGYPAYPLPSYPAQPGGYPPQPFYPPAPGGYPAGGPGVYPPAAGGPGGYPPSTGPYPPAPGAYPPAPGGYPPSSGFAYPPQ